MEYGKIAEQITDKMKKLGILASNMSEYELKAWMTMIVAEVLQPLESCSCQHVRQ